MASVEERFDTAVKESKIPGTVLLAKSGDGSFEYAKAFGPRSLLDGSEPMKVDDVFLLASQTKLMTTIAALQVVEKGLIGLDEDVSIHLPDLAKLEVLHGFDADDKPILKRRENAITLRHLLTHSSGLAYDVSDPALIKYRHQRGEPTNSGDTVLERFGAPLVYEPGNGWCYGPSIDWSGKLVEKLTGEDLDRYMTKNIWAPLGIKDITFWPDKHDMKARLAGMNVRTPDGKLVNFDGPFINTGSKDAFGGHGAYASMPEFMKVMMSILLDDEKLLRKETAAQMFQPQLSPVVLAAQKDFMQSPMAAAFVGEFPPEIGVSWGLGGLLTTQDGQGRRKKATLIWGGIANTFWSIDREAGLCCVLGVQVLPPGDPDVEDMINMFEKAMFEKSAAAKA